MLPLDYAGEGPIGTARLCDYLGFRARRKIDFRPDPGESYPLSLLLRREGDRVVVLEALLRHPSSVVQEGELSFFVIEGDFDLRRVDID